jgi:hypothetical protein
MSKTAAVLARRSATVVTRIGEVTLSKPVFGSVYDRNGGVEFVLAADVNRETGEVTGKRAPERDEAMRAAWTVPASTEVEAIQGFTEVPEGTVGVHYCKQTERHAEGSEWYNPEVPVTSQGFTFRFVRGDKVTTAFCPVCTKKHSKDQAARVAASEAAVKREAELADAARKAEEVKAVAAAVTPKAPAKATVKAPAKAKATAAA